MSFFHRLCPSLVALLLAHGAVAKTADVPLAELVSRAHVIVVGTVLSQNYSEGEGGMIYTTTEIQVENGVKGTAAATVQVRTIGGAVNGFAVHAPSEARFTAGERVVLYLEPEDGLFRTVGKAQGKQRVVGNQVHRIGHREPYGSLSSLLEEIERLR